MAKNILVTGGAGYIGSHACRALFDAGYTPIVFDNLSAGYEYRVKWGPFVQGDVLDTKALEHTLESYKPAAIMHFAGLISVPDSVKNPAETYRINTQGTLNLLEAARKFGIHKVVFSSTAAVYGVPNTVPIPEDLMKNPINPYGHSKLMVEQMLADYHTAYGFTYAALRYFNAAGAEPQHGLGYQRNKPFHLIPMAIMAVIGKAPPLKVFGNDYPTPDGSAVRDYIHVTDLVDAHIKALNHLLQGGGPLTLNLGTSKGASVFEIVREIEILTNKPMVYEQALRRAGDPPILVADAEQANKILGWKPKVSDLKSILQSELEWQANI